MGQKFTVSFENGQEVDFDRSPSPQDIEEVTKKLGIKRNLTPPITPPPQDNPSWWENMKESIAPTGSILRKILPEGKNVPEILGSTGASLFAARKATPLGMVVSGGGAVLGDITKQGLQLGGVVEGYPPETFGGEVKQLGGAFLRGAGAEFAGRTIGKFFHPFSGSVTPEIESAVEKSIQEGITPPLSTMTNAKSVQAAERMGELTPFGGGITQMANKATKDFGDFTGRVGDTIGANSPPEVAGNLLKEALSGYVDKYNQTKDALYNSVMPLVKDLKPQISNTVSTLKDIIGRRSGEGEPAGLNQVRNWLQEIESVNADLPTLQGGKSSSINTFDELRKFRTNVGQRTKFNDPASSGLQSDLRDLYGSISRDLDATASAVSPEIGKSLQAADEFYAQGKNTLKSKMFNALQNAKPEDMHKVLITPNSPSTVEAAKELMGDSFNIAKRQWFDDIVRRSPIGRDGIEGVSPQKLSSNIREFGSTVEAMFKDSPEQMDAVNRLEQIANLLGRGKAITSGSQTAYIQQSILPLITSLAGLLAGGFTGHGTAGGMGGFLGGLGMQGALAKGITSGVGREFLTTGYPTAGKYAGQLAGYGARLGLSDLLENNDNKIKSTMNRIFNNRSNKK